MVINVVATIGIIALGIRWLMLVFVMGSLYTKQWPTLKNILWVSGVDDLVAAILSLTVACLFSAGIFQQERLSIMGLVAMLILAPIAFINARRSGVNIFEAPPPVEFEKDDTKKQKTDE